MAILSFIHICDLNKFASYLNKYGVDIEEYNHTILHDSSEFAMFICKKNSRTIAYLAAHYIDAHYAALANLSEGASDTDIIEALINAEKGGMWRAPVEPVIYIASDEFVKIIKNYSDSFPENAVVYINQYRGEAVLLRSLVDSMTVLAKYLDLD